MLIHQATKNILFNLKEPARVLNVIPTARIVKVRGVDLVAVPDKMDEVKVLNNIGFQVDSPMLRYYSWPGQYTPFETQKKTAAFMASNKRAFCLNDMGVGKTLSILWAYDYLRSVGLVDKMLVTTPLSTLERVWGDEIFNNFPKLTFSVVHGTREKRWKALDKDVNIYLINHDGIKTNGIEDRLKTRSDISLITIDEIAESFRNSGTDCFRAMKRIIEANKWRRVWGMTGTPTPNAPTDAWAQCKLVVPQNVTSYFTKFRDQTMKQINQFKWVAKRDAMDTVYAAMRPAIRFERSECIDLPPAVYQYLYVQLTQAQEKAYSLMLNQLAFEVRGKHVLAVNEAVKAMKLVQVACGAAYDTDGDAVEIDCSNRIAVVKDTIQQAGHKVIVFAPFKSALVQIKRELDKHYICALIDGGVSKSERDDIFAAFQSKSDPLRVIIAQPGTMSHGLTLTESNTIIWFSPINSAETFQQANARITRAGQVNTQFIVMIEGSDVERSMYRRLKSKESMQGVLLDMFKEEAA